MRILLLSFVFLLLVQLTSSASSLGVVTTNYDLGQVHATHTDVAQIHSQVLLDRTTLTILGPGAYLKEHEFEVIVNNLTMAERFRTNYSYYDEFSKVLMQTGEIKSNDSNKPIKAKKKNIRDIAAYDGFSIASSGRLKVMTLPLPESYPATIKFHTKTEINESVAFPSISWNYGPNVLVENGELIITGELEQVLLHIIDPNNLLSKKQTVSQISYKLNQLIQTSHEDFSPNPLQSGPSILLAPKQGVLEGSSGNFSSWAGLGAWTSRLLDERSTLPAEAKEDIESLVKDIENPLERIRQVYSYMQNRTHYVSIQLGIGGFKPMKPEDVHANGYGDCKALSNYTRLLLDVAGVDAYYCIIGVGEREILYPEFASVNQANHAILAVPLEGDTLWLECTSQLTPANFIGKNAAGRYALLVKDGTGKLVKTHGSSAIENQLSSLTTFKVDTKGNGVYNKSSTAIGTEVDHAFRLSLSSPQERTNIIRQSFKQSVNDLDVIARIIDSENGPVGIITEKGTASRITKKVGKRLLLSSFGYQSSPAGPLDTLNRTAPVLIPNSFRRVDTVRYIFRSEVNVLVELPRIRLASPHATYTLSAKQIQKGIELIRTYEVQAGIYPSESIGEFAEFYRRMKKANSLPLGLEIIRPKGP